MSRRFALHIMLSSVAIVFLVASGTSSFQHSSPLSPHPSRSLVLRKRNAVKGVATTSSFGANVPSRRDAFSTTALPLAIGDLGSLATTAYQTAGVQKVLELGVIAGVGASLRSKLDAKAITTLLLTALVPAIISSSLSSLTLSPDMGYVVLMGLILTSSCVGAGELASRFVIKKKANTKEGRTIRRTAAMQLGSMAPALSVFSFVREFVGGEFPGLAALADIPGKIYILIIIRKYLQFRGVPKESNPDDAVEKPSKLDRLRSAFKDPFNLAIGTGLALAAAGRPVATLGFVGNAVGSLAAAQTAVLFLLIGLKLKFGGERPKLCMRLLLARHGFLSLFTTIFLAACIPKAAVKARLAAVLCSQAACSIIAFGQMNTVSEEVDGYDTDLAFDIVALSYPMTIFLNTAACLFEDSYVQSLPFMGTGFLFLSALLGKFRRTSGEKD